MMIRARIRVASAVAALAVVVAASGCTGGPPKGPVSPGVDDGFLGGVSVIGYLAESDGGWTVFDADPASADGPEPEPLAVLVPGSVDIVGIEALDGRYVWAAGRSKDGKTDAPEIRVDGIDVAVEPGSAE